MADNAAHEFVQALEGEVRLDASQFDNGQAQFFSYRHPDGTRIDFFILKSTDGILRAAFDACDVCYQEKLGYRQEGDEMVCNNCNQRFDSRLINVVRGGCNPSPLRRSLDGEQLVLAEADLRTGRRYF